MSYQAGDRLGSYEIVDEIGSGGMGAVYRARDVRLDRFVAIKVLAGRKNVDSPARLERLKREARAISKLNHPNICTLFDVGEHEGAYFLVLEHIEGKTLREALTRFVLPLRDALRIGAEVADGLAAAHREAVVHRDLKPGNIMVTRAGAKILDFGLARFAAPDAREDDDEIGPTLSRPLTSEGVVVGTPSYMAPEQITGESVDARTDLFALGVVLYETIAGRRPFDGDTPSKVTASILRDDPRRLDAFVPGCPAHVGRLVDACLAKDPEARWQSASDLARELRWSAESDGERRATTTSARRFVPWLVAAVALIGLALSTLGRREDALPIEALSVAAPPGSSFDGFHPALSPDGRRLAFSAADAEGRARLWIRDLITAEDESLPGDYPVGWQPFPLFAKNGEELTWSELNAVKAFVLRDGVERVLFEGNSGRRGLARSDDGWLLMAPHNRSPLFVAREGDEDVRVVTALDETEISHRHPQFLPDGEHFLFWAVTPDPSKSAACVGSLSEGKLRCLVDTMSPAIYAESHLFFVRDGALFAQPFDRRSLTLKGEATLVVGSVGAPIGFPANFAVSENGVLAYGPDETSEPTRLVWYDREGNELGELGPRGDYDQIVLSPDGERVAAQMVDQTTNSMDVWTIDRRGVPTRLTSWPLFDGHPVWSPSGDRLLFSSDRGGGTNELYVDVLDDDEPPRLLLDSEGSPEASDWDRQDRIWFSLVVTPRGRDIWVLRDGAAEPFLATEHNELTPQVSPDGAWLAFVSDVSGRLEVYAQPLRRSGERKRLSHDGGQQPRWRGDGRELFYLDLDGTVMAVDFEAAYAGRARARALFRPSIELPAIWSTYAPTPDGERFLIVEKPPERPPFAYTVLLNWRNAAERR